MDELTTTWCLELHQALIESFNLEGFELLCSDLNLDIDELEGQALSEKVGSLIHYMEQEQRLSELVAVCKQLHSRASWDDIHHILPQSTPFIPLSERFSMEIQPAILSKAGTCEVIINNEGIQRTSYTIMGSDPIGILNLADGQERQKMVSPGQTAKVILPITPKKRPLIGFPQRHTFTIYVHTAAHHQKAVNGQIIVNPILPTWITTFVVRLLNLITLGVR